VHRNPVKRGLVQEPEQWLWSSFRYCKYGEVGLVRVNDCDIVAHEGGGSGDAGTRPLRKSRKERGTQNLVFSG
jgi:hypothetical protein